MVQVEDTFCKEYSKITEKEQEKLLDIRQNIIKQEKMLDWIKKDTTISEQELSKLIEVGTDVKKSCDIFLVIGIGGSFLGSKALIEAFRPYFSNSKPEIIFLDAGSSVNFMGSLLFLCFLAYSIAGVWKFVPDFRVSGGKQSSRACRLQFTDNKPFRLLEQFLSEFFV